MLTFQNQLKWLKAFFKSNRQKKLSLQFLLMVILMGSSLARIILLSQSVKVHFIFLLGSMRVYWLNTKKTAPYLCMTWKTQLLINKNLLSNATVVRISEWKLAGLGMQFSFGATALWTRLARATMASISFNMYKFLVGVTDNLSRYLTTTSRTSHGWTRVSHSS